MEILICHFKNLLKTMKFTKLNKKINEKQILLIQILFFCDLNYLKTIQI